VTNWRCQIIQIDLTSIPRECVVVTTIANSFVENCVVFSRYPACAAGVNSTTFEELTFLNLQVDNAVLLEEAEAGNDPVWGRDEFSVKLSWGLGSG
jgi:hypothetical protein